MAMESRGRLIQQQQGSRLARQRSEVTDQFEPLRLAAAQGVQRLAQGQVPQPDGFERGQAGPHVRRAGQEAQGIRDAHAEDVGDGRAVPFDRQDLGLEPATLADGTGHEHVREELHLHPFKAEPQAMVAAPVAAVEGEAGRAHPGLLGGGRRREQLPDGIPRLDIERGVRAGRAGDRSLVDQDGFGDRLGAPDPRARSRILGGKPAMGQEALVDRVVEEGGFAGARDPAQADKAPQRDPHVQAVEVVLLDPVDLQERRLGVDRPPLPAGRDPPSAGEIRPGDALPVLQHPRHRALEDDVAPARTRLRADFDHVVGRLDHRLVVFDHDHAVAGMDQGTDDRDQAADVARMQADARLVHHEQGVDQRGAEAAGQVDPLNLAPGQGARRPVRRQVAEADLVQVPQAGEDRVEGELGRPFTHRRLGGGDQTEEAVDRQPVKVGQRVPAPLPAERFGLEPGPAAGRTRVVRAVARKEDPHVHLVGVLLEPAEKPLHPVPVLRPFLAVFGPVAGFALDDKGLLLRRQLAEGQVGPDSHPLGEDPQVVLGRAVDGPLPAPDRALVDRERRVGYGQAVVDVDHPAESPAHRAGSERRIEREEGGRGRPELASRLRRVQAARVVPELGQAGGGKNPGFAAPEVHRRFDRLGEARHRAGLDLDPVLDDEDPADPREDPGVGQQVLDPVEREVRVERAGREHAHVGLVLQAGEDFGPGKVLGAQDLEGDDDREAGAGRQGLRPDPLGIVVLDFRAGLRVEAFGDVAEPDLEEVRQLGHRADGRAGRLDRVGLFDGDRGPDVLDRVDPRLVEQLEELAGVGAERLDVAALALGMEGLEDQRALARAAQPGDDDVEPEPDDQVETLEIVLAHPEEADALRLRGGSGRAVPGASAHGWTGGSEPRRRDSKSSR